MRLSDPAQYQSIVDAEWNIIYDKLQKCADSGAKVVLSRLAIGDLGTQFFADRDIFCAGRVRAACCFEGLLVSRASFRWQAGLVHFSDEAQLLRHSHFWPLLPDGLVAGFHVFCMRTQSYCIPASTRAGLSSQPSCVWAKHGQQLWWAPECTQSTFSNAAHACAGAGGGPEARGGRDGRDGADDGEQPGPQGAGHLRALRGGPGAQQPVLLDKCFTSLPPLTLQ